MASRSFEGQDAFNPYQQSDPLMNMPKFAVARQMWSTSNPFAEGNRGAYAPLSNRASGGYSSMLSEGTTGPGGRSFRPGSAGIGRPNFDRPSMTSPREQIAHLDSAINTTARLVSGAGAAITGAVNYGRRLGSANTATAGTPTAPAPTKATPTKATPTAPLPIGGYTGYALGKVAEAKADQVRNARVQANANSYVVQDNLDSYIKKRGGTPQPRPTTPDSPLHGPLHVPFGRSPINRKLEEQDTKPIQTPSVPPAVVRSDSGGKGTPKTPAKSKAQTADKPTEKPARTRGANGRFAKKPE